MSDVPRVPRAYLIVMRMYTGVLFLVVFPFFFLLTLASASVILLHRGPQFVRWRSPRHYVGFLHWAAFEWNYHGLGGQQIGRRALGLEVSYSGVLR